MLSLAPLAQLTAATSPSDASATPAVPVAPAGPAAPAGPGPEATTNTAISGTPASGPAKAPSSPFGGLTFPMIILMFVLLYFIMFRGQRKDEKKRKSMIAEMKKGDRVMTIGGLVARVVSIDGEEVVLKVDESANVKATYTKSSIQRVLGNEEKK